MNKIFLSFFANIIFTATPSFAENNHQMDSLRMELHNMKSDTMRLRIYELICSEYDYENVLYFGKQAIKLADNLMLNPKHKDLREQFLKQKLNILYYMTIAAAETNKLSDGIYYSKIRKRIYEELNDTIEIAEQISLIGGFYITKGDIISGFNYLKQGLQYTKSVNYKAGIAMFYQDIGEQYLNVGDTSQAIANLEKVKSIYIDLKDSIKLARNYLLLGQIYGLKHNIYKSLMCFKLAEKIYLVRNKKSSFNTLYLYIGSMYSINQRFSNSLIYFNKSLQLAREVNDSSEIAFDLSLIGNVHIEIKEFAKAKIKLNESLKIYRFQDNQYGMASNYYSLANLDYRKNEFLNAKKNIDSALTIVHKQDDVRRISNFEYLAFQIDSALGYHESALNHYLVHIKIRDELNNKEITKAAISEKFQDEIDKQKATQEKKDALAKKEIQIQKVVRNSFIGGFILILLITIVTFRSLQQNRKAKTIIEKQKEIVEHQKQEVEEKNREILDSIEYALRIQTAILPPQKIVKQYLENSFILYKPKDIVAGDFYWMETVNDLVLFAACDCTGHGVPGAMVSVVCHNALNRAVREFGLTQPASILNKTTEIVLENFSKSEEEIQDGMDISICALNTKTKTLEWAGANNPLWLISNGNLIETKADKQCIGFNDNVKPFTNHQFQLKPNTTIYLFSDGFPDQFGGQPERKLTKNRFKELLLSIQQTPIQQQALELDNFIKNYKKEIEQTDDILLIGVSV
jgi:serine phosphatase RsbU (regulator of sigma subunit)